MHFWIDFFIVGSTRIRFILLCVDIYFSWKRLLSEHDYILYILVTFDQYPVAIVVLIYIVFHNSYPLPVYEFYLILWNLDVDCILVCRSPRCHFIILILLIHKDRIAFIHFFILPWPIFHSVEEFTLVHFLWFGSFSMTSSCFIFDMQL